MLLPTINIRQSPVRRDRARSVRLDSRPPTVPRKSEASMCRPVRRGAERDVRCRWRPHIEVIERPVEALLARPSELPDCRVVIGPVFHNAIAAGEKRGSDAGVIAALSLECWSALNSQATRRPRSGDRTTRGSGATSVRAGRDSHGPSGLRSSWRIHAGPSACAHEIARTTRSCGQRPRRSCRRWAGAPPRMLRAPGSRCRWLGWRDEVLSHPPARAGCPIRC